jgi:glycosyltransferase involved in cell wall biosynthesis
MADTILHIREASIFGSPERLIIGQVRHARAFRYLPVTFRKGGRENPFAAELKSLNLPCREVSERFTGDLTTIGRLAALIKDEHPALIVTHEYKSNFYGRRAARRAGVPHLIHFHGVTSEDRRVHLYNRIDLAVMRRVQGIITVSEQTRQRLIDAGVDGSKIRVVINAVAEQAFERAPFESPSFDDNAPLLVAAGRLSYEKGFDILIEGLATLLEGGHAANLLIYGDGPEKENLARLIASLELSGRVKLMGFIRDVRPPFGAMQILVVPSRSEGFPLVLLEAWAQGAPVVAHPVGGLPDLVVDNVNGLLARAATPEALAEALSKALAMPDFKSRCGAAGQALTRDKFNFERQLDSLEAIYREFAR